MKGSHAVGVARMAVTQGGNEKTGSDKIRLIDA